MPGQSSEIQFIPFTQEMLSLVNLSRTIVENFFDTENHVNTSIDQFRQMVRLAQDEINEKNIVEQICHENEADLKQLLHGALSFQARLYLRAVRPSSPQSEHQEHIGYHRESFFGPDFRHSYNVWIPLKNIHENNTLFFIPESSFIPDEEISIRKSKSANVEQFSDAHRIGLLYDEIEIVDGVNLGSARQMDFVPEHFAVFPSALIHGNGRNEGDATRFSLDFRIISTAKIIENNFNFAAGGRYFTDLTPAS